MAGAMKTEEVDKTSLKGMPDNPGRDPKRMAKDGPGSMGDIALRDAIAIVICAWLVIILLAYSLRHHNV